MQNVARIAPCARALVSHGLQRNISASSVAMASAPQDSVQKLYVEKIREYAKLSASGKIKMDPQNQKDFEAESEKLKKLYGGGDLTKFPEFQFQVGILTATAESWGGNPSVKIDFESRKDV